MENKYCYESDYKTVKAVKKEYPGYYKVVKVCGGWIVFFTSDDYNIWRNQR